MRITPELFRRNCSSCAHRALIVHFELDLCSVRVLRELTIHQALTKFHQRSLTLLSVRSVFIQHSLPIQSLFTHRSLTIQVGKKNVSGTVRITCILFITE